MKILCLETSTKNFSLGLAQDGKMLKVRNLYLEKILSSSIIPAIEEILKKAKVTLKGLDGFAVGLGPGSFTSLRVGLSTVKALAFATQKPVVGIPSLDILAMNAIPRPGMDICVICDAKRNLLFSCVYELKNGTLRKKTEYLLVDIKKLLGKIKKQTLFIGDGISLCREAIEHYGAQRHLTVEFADTKQWFPYADQLAFLAEPRFRKKHFDNPQKLIPLYLYPDDCQVSKK
ncbi:MAG TPA: tRNA (adenosine(37)-N6)-threonylcarbamoyltransferase complex dimerization subunit type 1 TsaB [Candidatus Omnitrophota bacterium]|nr:tRNA (adenosine(37)-N6)-threonylcarbamoyltransferase complex dimerization subunit type 1 TsaB [Candidatus Omnitrophota bacterium]HPD84799.1 tRNA (adenosine(37)-N6)-threonylcarbamoyltransferase complex dimerization subunit type 1 TsaB [Candidatus Omnitrophota bacterium]HRZ03657.1 tRNA (adenosine(37)-N6)-threonylcarbamoyltransferase complex dimerization subunit type 1 TsaB [Candidatus Omnitrophota bacterium]